jgi:hypothetical protein
MYRERRVLGPCLQIVIAQNYFGVRLSMGPVSQSRPGLESHFPRLAIFRRTKVWLSVGPRTLESPYSAIGKMAAGGGGAAAALTKKCTFVRAVL